MEPERIANGISEYDTDRNTYVYSNAYPEWYDKGGK